MHDASNAATLASIRREPSRAVTNTSMQGLIPRKYKRILRDQTDKVSDMRRRLSRHQGNPLPNCLILGAQKRGTSSLFNDLLQHPDVLGSSRKQVHYFDRHYGYGLDWYRSFFPAPPDGETRRIRLEATPYYLYHPAVPGRVLATLPDARFIVLLRDPVERAYSHYLHSRERGFEPLGLTEALDAEDGRLAGEEDRLLAGQRYTSYAHQHQSYQDRGLYARQLARWLALFSADRFLFLKSEEFFNDPETTIARLLDFLGVRPWPGLEPSALNVNEGNSALPQPVRERLLEFYRPANRELRALAGSEFDWDRPAG